MEDVEDYRSLIKDLCMEKKKSPKGLALKKTCQRMFGPKKKHRPGLKTPWSDFVEGFMWGICQICLGWMIKDCEVEDFPKAELRLPQKLQGFK